jgi:hypothetical protein
MARASAWAPCGLWPPSSHTSAPSGAQSISGPRVNRCSRAGHSTVPSPVSTASSRPQPSGAPRQRAWRSAAMATPAFSIW